MVVISTAFYWKKGRKEFICERRGEHGSVHFGGEREFMYVFKTPVEFGKLFSENPERIIYDELGVAWTVDLLTREILKKGYVVFCEDYDLG